MLLDDRYAALTSGSTHGCPECGVSLRPRVGTDVQAVEPVLESLRGPQQRAYLSRVFTDGEIADSGLADGAELLVAAQSLAARFAAKEAVVKVLRPAADTPRPPWKDIEVRREPSGEPRLQLHGAAARHAASAGLTSWTCSLSHDAGVAVAVVAALESPHVPTPSHDPREVHHDNR